MTDAATVRAWLAAARTATLSTILDDARAPGSPFGTVVPYALDAEGRPFVVISELAVHTKNLRADPRASLVVSEPGTDDVQAAWRVTLVGRMRVIDDPAPYLARLPQSLPGFAPWVLDVDATRYIAGFGRMGWL